MTVAGVIAFVAIDSAAVTAAVGDDRVGGARVALQRARSGARPTTKPS